MAGTRLKFLTETNYEYRHDTGLNENATGFQYSNPKIFLKKPYNIVKNLPFADNPITKHYDMKPDEYKKTMKIS